MGGEDEEMVDRTKREEELKEMDRYILKGWEGQLSAREWVEGLLCQNLSREAMAGFFFFFFFFFFLLFLIFYWFFPLFQRGFVKE